MRMKRKECDDARFQYDWLCQLPSHRRPSVMRLIDSRTYTMEHITSEHPTHWYVVWTQSQDALWRGSDWQEILRGKYIEYCHDRMRILKAADRVGISELICELQCHRLSPVRLCHGDLTLENCFKRGQHVVYIDPGHTRGLPCRELDESKILQSLDGWSMVRHGRTLEPDALLTFETRRVHWILLLTHYIRLLHHQHPSEALEFAQRRVCEITEMLTCPKSAVAQ